MLSQETNQRLGAVLQEYDETIALSCDKVIECLGGHLVNMSLYKSHSDLSLLIRNRQTIERQG
jgi:hypothetical protein